MSADKPYDSIRNEFKKGISDLLKEANDGRLPEIIENVIIDDEFTLTKYSEAEEDVLADYTTMNSPGIITFYLEKMRAFYFSFECHLHNKGIVMLFDDMDKVQDLLFESILWHEQFHFFCDVQKRIHNYAKDKLMEEALAVAYSSLMIEEANRNWSSRISRISDVIKSEFKKAFFNHNAPGYRDWRHYSLIDDFKDGLVKYIQPGNYSFLRGCGVDVGTLIMTQLKEITENPNAFSCYFRYL